MSEELLDNIETTYHIRCRYPDCSAVGNALGIGMKLEQAGRYFADGGWVAYGGRAFCPVHAKAAVLKYSE